MADRPLALTRIGGVAVNVDLAPELRRGLAADELSLAYQPIVALPGRTAGRCEALLRWTSSARGSVEPSAFLPVIARAGLSAKLGRFVLGEAISAVGRHPGLGVSINLNADELTDRSLPNTVAALLAEHQVLPSAVTLEITEGALIRCGGVGWRVLAQLAELGVRTSLDDFGVGFSQLSYLMQFTFDELKIDRSFVSQVLLERSARVIIASVVQMADQLGLETVAEGIETNEQCDAVAELGATFGQGYLFGAAGALS